MTSDREPITAEQLTAFRARVQAAHDEVERGVVLGEARQLHTAYTGNPATVLQLLDELEGERVANEFGIQSLTTENGVPTLTTVPTTEQARGLVLAMSLACGRMLDDDQAQNYVEFEVSPANQPGYIVHVRRAGGPSPHTLRREAENRAGELERRLDRVTDLFEAWAAEENEHRTAGQLGIAEGLHVAIEALQEAVHA